MTDPKRYLDDPGSDLGARLLRSADADGPSERSWQRALGSVAAATAATAVTGSGAASLGTGALSIWLKWLGIGAIAGLVTTFGVNQLVREAPAPPLTAATRTETLTAPVPKLEAALPPASEAVPAPVKASHATVTSVTPEASAPTSAPSDSLARELALVDAARKRLGAGDATGASAKLDEYAREFPRGRFGEEAALIRAEASLLRGDCNTVRTLRTAFDGDSGRSVLGRRWKALSERCP